MLTEQIDDQEIEAGETTFSTEKFVSEKLAKREAIDKEGLQRPIYVINGQEVAFRNRQEAPVYDDSDVVVAGGGFVYPLERDQWDDQSQSHVKTDETATRQYVDAHQHSAERIIATNTPEGMLSAAALLVESNEESKRLMDLAASFHRGKEFTPAHKEVLDTILAAVSIDDENKPSHFLDMDGWAVALAALSGDETAKQALNQKRQALIDAERNVATDSEIIEISRSPQYEAEPLPLDQLALVHSTRHEINRDDHGNVVLRPAGQLREDKYPRASLHFTLNSQVGDVYANGEAQTWSSSNKIIVANFKKVVDTAHQLPKQMAGMDTWFVLNPGQELVLPDALVVEPVAELPNGAIIQETDGGVQYVEKEEYTSDELDSLTDLREKYGTSGIRELALRIAMARQGVPVDLMDSPSGDGHGMWSRELGARVQATANMLGLPSHKHFDSPEAYAEQTIFYEAAKLTDKVSIADPYFLQTEFMGTHNRAAIEVRRQALAAGFYPARPNTPTERAIRAQEHAGSGV